MAAALEYTGLKELVSALREIDTETLGQVKQAMGEVGQVVTDEARRMFEPFDRHSAQGFETRVRVGAEALVVVGQRLTKTTGTKPSWGALQMTEALIPARSKKLNEASYILENRVGRVLSRHGF